jgi:hypothetical protein
MFQWDLTRLARSTCDSLRAMSNASFLKMIQARIATLAIGASTLRNQGASNVVSNTREFLKRLDLGASEQRRL